MAEHNVVVLGSGGVGKSALTVQFVHFHFLESYDPTIEDAYRRQVVVDDIASVLAVLDTAGQEEYSAMRGQYMAQGKGFLLCYAITSRDSFDEVKALYELVLQAKDSERFPMVLVATKCDLEDHRKVSKEEGIALAKTWGCPFVESSAKERINVEESFCTLVREIRNFEFGGSDKSSNSSEVKKTTSKSKKLFGVNMPRMHMPNVNVKPQCTIC